MNMTLVNIALVFLDLILFIYMLHIAPIVTGELLEIWRLFKCERVTHEADAEMTD